MLLRALIGTCDVDAGPTCAWLPSGNAPRVFVARCATLFSLCKHDLCDAVLIFILREKKGMCKKVVSASETMRTFFFNDNMNT